MILEDEALRFDNDIGRYYLRLDFVNEHLTDLSTNILDNDFTLNPSKEAESVIERACDILWAEIERLSVSPSSMLFEVTHKKKSFLKLRKALLMQLEYFLQIGDTANAVGTRELDRLHKGAIAELKSAGVLTVEWFGIPKRSEW